MKSSSKCEVEISIIMDGEETVEPIPECLQGAVMATPGDTESHPGENVTLPLRYTQMINCTDCEKQRIGDKLSDREKDLHTALKWIKQEIVSWFCFFTFIISLSLSLSLSLSTAANLSGQMTFIQRRCNVLTLHRR